MSEGEDVVSTNESEGLKLNKREERMRLQEAENVVNQQRNKADTSDLPEDPVNIRPTEVQEANLDIKRMSNWEGENPDAWMDKYPGIKKDNT